LSRRRLPSASRPLRFHTINARGRTLNTIEVGGTRGPSAEVQ
jgi:hypothetical protein